MGMEFEWDDAKDAANRAKHGISLADAVNLDWPAIAMEIDARHSYGEVRYSAYAVMQERLFVCIMTFRDNKIRIISLRKANTREERRHGKTKAT